MSDIVINVYYDEATSKKHQAGKRVRVRKNRFHRRKMEYLERKGYVEVKHKHNHRMGQSSRDQAAPCPNGASTSRPSFPAATSGKSFPPPSSTAGASHSSSSPSTSTHRPADTKATTATTSTSHRPSASCSQKQTSAGIPTKYVAIDCEMVGTGPKGRISQLARCSIVSYEGDVIYDKFIKPSALVTDYRTRWSGIRYSDLANATPYFEARKEILRLLMGKVVIGHAVHNDFKVLSYSHPSALTRDTSRIPLLNAKAGFAENECASLKRLTKAIFNRDIQTGKKGHSSVEDAKATMELYKVVEVEWERELASRAQAS